MAGHSKWANTKHRKAAVDAKRAKINARYIKQIEVAARNGGPDPAGNPALDLAVSKAKKNSVPNDNIDRAIKRGAGLTGDAVEYEEIMYEVRGPQGSALLVECLTDNRNRAASEVRVAVTRSGGTVADPGSVAYMFQRKGVVSVPKEGLTEDDVLAAVLEAGVEEVIEHAETFEVQSEPQDLQEVVKALEDAGLAVESDEVEFVSDVKVDLDLDAAKKFLRLHDALEDLDDVQNVHTNADLSADTLAALDAES
ncbi:MULTISPECIES: YebC/PmpR family DNA-binding transcriptional regulator [unclassified Nesterenkonia]|uniref:YebC/PmpR family DNA-binding transcriptional regulator n=1 Tax=unclassified Nesterenkonia TaxID=2629769 RepID=UPI000871CE25|nr:MULTISPECIES: YebC/PmpR family DNA-binding transcriptional regulator [unclassified Nesterenkonia]MDS2171928.1 YebC/PmpR family DNA-binding transcriptional regulator [Nesterenkonia sp. CL21]OSM44811.1 YebC/PmpR family DNA-binding transcriptional regulator [Nesterenkonia sp. PF2B19]